jgi:hypothetical protein
MLAFANQSGEYHPGPANVLAVPVVLVATAAAGWLLIRLLERCVPPVRQRLHARIASSRRLMAAANAESSARAMMDELCPDGWHAEIVLFSSAGELPLEAPDPERTRVQLHWRELNDSAELRRIWARDVKSALEAMVADRVMEETLQRIEQQALADGANWPDA